MSADFRTRQLRVNQIINSGTLSTSPMLIYGVGSATDQSGGFNSSHFTTGSDTWLFISGSSGTKNSSTRGVVTFGGDIHVSGTIYGGNISGSGSPGGSTTSIQFNDGGTSFGGDSDLTWQKISNVLTLTGSLLTTGLAQFAGGYGSTGVTISPTGNISTDGNLIVDGTTNLNNTTIITGSILTTGPAQFAGGYGSTGVTVTAAGDVSADGVLTVEGKSSLKTDVTLGSSTSNRLTINSYITSSIIPSNDVAFSLGSPSLHWANIYTGDLHLRNDRGDWTIVEENDFLRIVNNKSGKNYKMVMESLDD
jgi:hypothetical protein